MSYYVRKCYHCGTELHDEGDALFLLTGRRILFCPSCVLDLVGVIEKRKKVYLVKVRKDQAKHMKWLKKFTSKKKK